MMTDKQIAKYKENVKNGLCTKCNNKAMVNEFGKTLTRCKICRDRDIRDAKNRKLGMSNKRINSKKIKKSKKSKKSKKNSNILEYDDPVELISRDPYFE